MFVGALCAILLLGAGVSPSSASSDTGDDARLVKAAKAVHAQHAERSAASAASTAGGDEKASAAEARSGGDATGDVPFCQGDITSWSAGYDAALELAAVAACSSNPGTSNHWVLGDTAIGWVIEQTGDDIPEYVAVYLNDGTQVLAGMVRMSDEVVTCEVSGAWDGNRRYSAVFAPSCIGTPAWFRLGMVMTWDENPEGDDCICPMDFAPEDDWGPKVWKGMPPVPGAGGSGYWMLGEAGHVYAFGDARHYGDADVAPLGAVAMDIASNPKDNAGYWIIDDDGHVFAFGSAPWLGNPSLNPGERATTIVGTKTGNGYYVFTDRGRAIRFGDAVHRGDMSGVPLNGPVLDSTLTGAGNGYYMVGSDGGVFSFNAQFHGSMGGQPLNQPVNGISGDPDNVGYWLVASDGGIFAFSAPFKGSMGSIPLNRPVVGMVSYGDGYLLVGADGGIFNFSNKQFRGSLGSNPPAIPIKAVAPIR